MQKCFFISTSWYDGPVPSQFKALGKALASRGHKVVMLTGQRKGVDSHDTNPAVFTFPSRRPTTWRDAVFFARLVRRFRPNCLITQDAAVNIMILVGFACRVPVRIAWHHTMSAAIDLDWRGSQLKRKFLRLRKRCVLKLATHIVAVSDAAREDVVEPFWVPGEKCLVFWNSLQDMAVQPAAESNDQVILCVGRLDRTKGQDTLIRAGARIREKFPEVTLRFIGDGSIKDDLRNLAHEVKFGENCQFLGQLPHKEVLAQMASAYVAVTPSRHEAFGLVVIEAMSLGTPVIGTKVGGIPEIIRDGLDGFLVPPDDPQALAAKIIFLLENPAVQQEMANNARQRFLDAFEQQKVISQQVEWLEGITGGL